MSFIDDNEELDEGKKKESSGGDELKALSETLTNMPTMIQSAVSTAVSTALTGFAQTQQQATAQQEAARAKAEEAKQDPPSFDGDLEDASREEFMGHIMNNIEFKLGKMLSGVNEKVDTTSTEARTDKLKRDVEIAKSKHSDFGEFVTEMRGIANDNPDLTIEDMYQLARARNPEKVEELAKKAKEVEEKKKGEEAKKNETQNIFGGLLPTSSVNSSNKSVGSMKEDEAANAAWDQVFKDVDPEVIGGLH